MWDNVAMNMEEMRPLPPQVVELLRSQQASPRLLAHLLMVHDVAARLTDEVHRLWPRLQFDAEAVQIGAATHDIGKVLYPDEVIGPGDEHAAAGERLLVQHGFPPEHARFARTHFTWPHDADPTLEDLLVALADELWRGERDEALEALLTGRIAAAVQDTMWAVFMDLDDVATELAHPGPTRVNWLAQFAEHEGDEE